jgi:hypothetical protein
MERSERAGRSATARSGALREEEGKADKRDPLVSCPERKMRDRDAVRPADWVGPWPVGCAPRRVKRKGERVGPCVSGLVGYVCVGFRPMVVKVIRV